MFAKILNSSNKTNQLKDVNCENEANWSGCALFVSKYRYVNFYQHPGSSNLIGWKLEVGVASYFIQHGKGNILTLHVDSAKYMYWLLHQPLSSDIPDTSNCVHIVFVLIYAPKQVN